MPGLVSFSTGWYAYFSINATTSPNPAYCHVWGFGLFLQHKKSAADNGQGSEDKETRAGGGEFKFGIFA
ncbi:MAG: hypothetical protein ACOX4Z_04250 [Desulfobulbus sp.]|jgi:hypothetical protein